MAFLSLNGRTFTGGNISIIGGQVWIDGKRVDGDLDLRGGTLDVRVLEGSIESLKADGNVSCGAVSGSVSAGGNATCDSVGGSVNAGGNVRCDKVGGSVRAGGNVRMA
jgi:hypothetical protein